MNFNIGLFLIIILSLAISAIFLQILAAIAAKKKILRLLDEGYYFIEVEVRWRQKELRPIHPNNIDFSTDEVSGKKDVPPPYAP
ncbi:hypothetical protein NQ314_019714 [Rhamnusium bicolor]|uniref:Uncharacterized protein n=1 Tax=Rhamnusium bicolor TaxID=1586634 RepID=A0AAV8WNS0_9CUCU|nr:hypothetical protein NQ314_019714 [Rhamnusium bicolor]